MHSYGYKPDKKDERDFLFKAVQRIDQLPPSIDLRNYCSAVRDQGNLGSCTGFSIATGLREFLELKTAHNVPPPPLEKTPSCLETIFPKTWFALKDKTAFSILSPMFLYYQERVLEDVAEYDSGAEMRDGMKVLMDTGVCPEIKYPYDVHNFTKKPSLVAMFEAGDFRISVFSRIIGLINLKSCLAVGGAAVIGFNVYESFESEDVTQTGRMPMPKTNDQLLGGHAVFVCGYMDDPTWAGGGYLIVKNSWGINWGDAGFFYMPYEFAMNPLEVSDIWTASV